jgi:hypothetical protein
MMAKHCKNIILGLTFLTGLVFNMGCDKQSTQDEGTLEGKISIGPICPVETDPPDPGCLPTIETFKAYPVSVWTSDGRRKVTILEPSLDGSFKAELQPGKYLIKLDIGSSNIGSSNLPVEITVTSGKTATLNILIDTGIR